MTDMCMDAFKPGHNSAAYGQGLDMGGDMVRYRATFTLPQSTTLETVDFNAADLNDARRRLRVMLATPHLPTDLTLVPMSAIEAERAEHRTRRARFLLRVLADHFLWLGGLGGQRADLPNSDLADVVLEGRDLTQANLRGSDLTNASLKRSRLSGANLSGAVLRGADLRGADLSGADLSNADLRGALLIGARLEGVDTWRANFAGAIITPEVLHQALNCRRQVERVAEAV